MLFISGHLAQVKKDTLKCWINIDFLYLATIYDIVILFGTDTQARNQGVKVRQVTFTQENKNSKKLTTISILRDILSLTYL